LRDRAHIEPGTILRSRFCFGLFDNFSHIKTFVSLLFPVVDRQSPPAHGHLPTPSPSGISEAPSLLGR
jgi:hypothetical protein